MKHYTTIGYLNGIIAAVSYGTNPLFALPMYSRGMEVNSVLFYRYLFAVIIYGLWLNFHKKISLKISLKEFGVLFLLAIAFSLSSLFLFDAFNFLDVGLACTILFVYPLMVALISRILFKEKMMKVIWLAIFMTIAGISMLYSGKPGENLSITGIILVLLSALMYSIYMVAVKQIKILRHLKSDKLTFYVMLLGLSVYVWNLKFCTELQPLNNAVVFGCAVMLAIFPTIISIEAITIAIKLIGATKTAIIGALEPLTALFFGVILFHETLTLKIIYGILLILTGVIFVIAHKPSHSQH